MARPPLPIGTHGQIRLYRLGQRRWRARTKFRDHDGVVREVERTGTSRAAAEQRLKLALRDRGRTALAGEISGDTKVAALARSGSPRSTGPSPRGSAHPPPPPISTGTASTGTSRQGWASSASAS